jgi:hypothetical protein
MIDDLVFITVVVLIAVTAGHRVLPGFCRLLEVKRWLMGCGGAAVLLEPWALASRNSLRDVLALWSGTCCLNAPVRRRKKLCRFTSEFLPRSGYLNS